MVDSLLKEFTEHTGHIFADTEDTNARRYIKWLQETVLFHRNAFQKYIEGTTGIIKVKENKK